MCQHGHDFSYTVSVRHIPSAGTEVRLTASDEERKRLAERFSVIEIPFFAATVRLEHADAGKVRAKGDFQATVVQTCGVTLDAFQQEVREEFDLLFKETASDGRGQKECVVDMDDECEPMENGVIELGETIAQLLSLSLDAFPKRKDAVFCFKEADDEKKSPFAVLETLRKK